VPEKGWKRVQRIHRRRLGVKPIDVGQQSREGGVDGESDWLAVESKERKRPIKWLLQGLNEAVGYVAGNKLPLPVVHFAGMRHDGDLVITRLKEFEEWLGSSGDESR